MFLDLRILALFYGLTWRKSWFAGQRAPGLGMLGLSRECSWGGPLFRRVRDMVELKCKCQKEAVPVIYRIRRNFQGNEWPLIPTQSRHQPGGSCAVQPLLSLRRTCIPRLVPPGQRFRNHAVLTNLGRNKFRESCQPLDQLLLMCSLLLTIFFWHLALTWSMVCEPSFIRREEWAAWRPEVRKFPWIKTQPWWV